MICDIFSIKNFHYYKSREGPFVVTFYHNDISNNNYKLYSHLKKLERKFNTLPIIRFDYTSFIKKFSKIKIPSPNHLMVIEGKELYKFYETTDLMSIEKILDEVLRLKIVNKFKNNKIDKIESIRLKPWFINSTHFTHSDMKNILDLTAEMQYKFPNITAFKFLTKNIKKKKNKIVDNSDINIGKEEGKLVKYGNTNSKSEIKYNFVSPSGNQIIGCTNKSELTNKEEKDYFHKFKIKNIDDIKQSPIKSSFNISISSKNLNTNYLSKEKCYNSKISSRCNNSILPIRKRILQNFKLSSEASIQNTTKIIQLMNFCVNHPRKNNFSLSQNIEINENKTTQKVYPYSLYQYENVSSNRIFEITEQPLDLSNK